MKGPRIVDRLRRSISSGVLLTASPKSMYAVYRSQIISLQSARVTPSFGNRLNIVATTALHLPRYRPSKLA